MVILLVRTPAAQEDPIRTTFLEIDLKTESFLTKLPRERVTAVVHVRNVDDRPHTLIEEPELPDGWHIITPIMPFELQPGQATVRLFGVLIPEGTTVATYPVTYRARDDQSSEVQASITLQVEVLPVVKLEARLSEAPAFVILGNSYTATFLVMNLGNTPASLGVSVRSSDHIQVWADVGPSVRLEPNSSHQIEVFVLTNVQSRQIIRHEMQLSVRYLENE